MVGCWEREKGVKGKNKTLPCISRWYHSTFVAHEEQFWEIGLWDADEFSLNLV